MSKFNVEVNDNKAVGHRYMEDDELHVSITRNGHQWLAITSTVDEWKQVIAAIEAHPLFREAQP